MPALAGRPGFQPRSDGWTGLARRAADIASTVIRDIRERATDGPTVAILAFGLLVAGTGVVGLAVTQGSASFGLHHVPVIRVPAGPVSALPAPSAAARPVARPVSLIIPAIGVRTRLAELGVTAGGVLQVPPATAVAGWYTGSPRPGAIGSSVIAGHVDSYRGPGVFFRLGLLRPPERIYVRRADGTLAAFRVTSVHTYLKRRFPTAAVYGPAPDPQLRLITCGGAFDPGLRSYLSNVVVYAVGIGPGGRPAPRKPGLRGQHHRYRPHRRACPLLYRCRLRLHLARAATRRAGRGVSPDMLTGMIVLVGGVAGSGKTTAGAVLADRLHWPFADADAFHPAANIAKMRSGVPLTDADRAPWLAGIIAWMEERTAAGEPAVAGCSALKRRYREQLLAGRPTVWLAFLEISRELAHARLAARHGHFFTAALLDSQFAELEPPRHEERLLVLDAARPPDQLAEEIIERLGLVAAGAATQRPQAGTRTADGHRATPGQT
jgi:carbohydrate kinase (thermoresistant glucokinase family)